MITISTQKYKEEGVLNKSVLDISIKILYEKKRMTRTEVTYPPGKLISQQTVDQLGRNTNKMLSIEWP